MIFDRISLTLRLDCEPELFYEVDTGAVYPLVHLPKGTKPILGRNIPVTGMFEIFELLVNTKLVGYLFKSSFAMQAHGGYLVSFLKNKGAAEDHEVVLKMDNLIIYNFPNRGTMAVSPKVTDSIAKILEAQ